MNPEAIKQCAQLIANADSLIIGAGAGLGVDSGLPDFRGKGGFWNLYPALGQAGLRFEEIASPAAFRRHPALAWGFYGHRLAMYRKVPPGKSFALLKRIADQLPGGAFVFTSNVDGHFQQAGFPEQRICEIHGSIHHLQCLHPCREEIWTATALTPVIDHDACLLTSEAPGCPHCGRIARPNILMFGDDGWISHRTDSQQQALMRWREHVQRPVVIEIGAGEAIPTVRWYCEHQDAPLIRINPNAPSLGKAHGVSLPYRGSEAMSAIIEALIGHGFFAS